MRSSTPRRCAVLGLCLALLVTSAVGCGTTTVYGPDDEVPVAARGRRPPPRPREVAPGSRDAAPPEVWRGSSTVAARCTRFVGLARDAAARHGVPAEVVQAIATVESKWTPSARSRAGASGLMQLMPKTARRLGCGDLFDPAENLACGAKLLARLLARYDGRMPYALAAYAVGSRSVDAAYEAGRAPPREKFIQRVNTLSRALGAGGCEALAEGMPGGTGGTR